MSDTSQPAAEDRSTPSAPDSAQPQLTVHPLTYSGVPMPMYSFPPGMVPTQPPRTKRRQVKNACTNCQKACKKCDDARPCLRCVKYGIAEECVDSQRKERQKGIKRGPYKKRDGKASSVDPQIDMGAPSAIPLPIAAGAHMPPYMAAPMGYPAGFFGQYPAPAPGKPGEAPAYYPQYYFAPIPMPPPTTGQEGEVPGYPAGFYPTFLTPYAPQPYPGAAMPYMVPAPPPRGPDGQPLAMAPPLQYAAYPQAYAKPPMAQQSPSAQGPQREASQDAGHQMMDPNMRRDARLDAVYVSGMNGSAMAKSG
ncbi:GAL4 domain-containing protein [Phanerochaete sordida]|uniref:Transcription activator of gluconeogenesis ERT1 n=1 Tax=Phanerochaete sordida TaxID=48140 RepID=A0A9P3LJ64_9APHY|nr:GAL4 domain-containing protein [Phanerochaete sordida]